MDVLDLPVGVVEAIVGQSRRWLTFVGQAGHAGTQPMEMRRDALVAAAEFVVHVEQTARATRGLRATVGSLDVEPGAVNVVPGSARLSLDVRHADDMVRHQALDSLIEQARRIGSQRRLEVRIVPILDQDAIPTDVEMTGRLAEAVNNARSAAHRLVSGAGHDAGIMASICPISMLFIRSVGGISHHPDEAVYRDDVWIALDAMIRFLETELERDE